MSNCYICEQEITPNNKYTEHILLNCLGGILTSSDLTCETCARDLDPLDTELYKSLHWIANRLNIKRHRGEPQDFSAILSATGQKILINRNDKHRLAQAYVNGKSIGDEGIDWQGNLKIEASNERELCNALKKIKKERASWSNKDINKLVKKSQKTQSRIGEITFQVGLNENCLRSICKMAINFYMYHDGERKYIAHLIPYLKGDKQEKANYVHHYYPSTDKIPEYLLRDKKVTHCLLIKGDPQNKCLYGLIQLFSSWQFFILLNDNYQGKELSESYIFDVLNRTEMNENLDFKMSHQEIQIVQNTCLTEENLQLSSLLITKQQNLLNFIKEKRFLDNL